MDQGLGIFLKKTVITVVLFTTMFPFFSFAAGLSVIPGRIDINTGVGQNKEVGIVVSNPTSDVMLVEVYADEFTEMVKVVPKSFTLQAGQSMKVKISAVFSQSGIFSSFISLVSRPLAERPLSAGAGIKLPFAIIVLESIPRTPFPWLSIIILFDAALLFFLTYLIINRRVNVRKD